MTKSELIEALAEKARLKHRESSDIVELILNMMIEALLKDDRIEVRGFGTFVNRRYAGYQGRNPKTGEKVSVAPKVVSFFKVGKDLKDDIDKLTLTKKESE